MFDAIFIYADTLQHAEEAKARLEEEVNQLKDQKADLTYRLTNTQDDIAATQTFSQDMQSQLVKRDEVSLTTRKTFLCCCKLSTEKAAYR